MPPPFFHPPISKFGNGGTEGNIRLQHEVIGHIRLASHFTKQPFHIRYGGKIMQRKMFVLFAGLVLLSLMIAPVGMANAQV